MTITVALSPGCTVSASGAAPLMSDETRSPLTTKPPFSLK
jgi:hypothetical protein